MTSFRRTLSKRIFNAFITIIAIMLLNFALFRMMPSDPAKLMMNRSPTTPESFYWHNVELMGLNDSLSDQLVKYFVMTFTLNWGLSYQWKLPVTDVIKGAIGWTALLLGVSSLFTFFFGVVLGKFAARRRGKTPDLAISTFGLFFYGMPVFWFGMILMVVFSSSLHWLPPGGYMKTGTSPFPLTMDKIVDILEHLVLPATALTVGSIAGIVLIMRNSLIDVLTEDYVVTAYAKGLTEKQVMRKHAGPNARLPIVTTIAMSTAFIIGGAFQIEVVFSYKGIGWYTMEAIWKEDYPMLQFIFFIGGVAIVVANLIADLVLVRLDPRVKII